MLYQLHCFLVISVLSYLLFEAEDFTGYEDFAVQSLYVFFVHVETQMVKRGRGQCEDAGGEWGQGHVGMQREIGNGAKSRAANTDMTKQGELEYLTHQIILV